MTKKLLSIILTIFLCTSIFGVLPVSAVTEYTDGYYTYTITDEKATITEVDKAISGDITIPSTLGGYSVTAIGHSAFIYCRDLISISIPNGVTSIGPRAFEWCENLTRITIPDSVISIGDYAFDFCFSLTNISLPNGVISIGRSAFRGCESLTNITLPDSITSIDSEAFRRCKSLTSITLPNGITSIGEDLFSGCDSLTNVSIPDSVTSIGSYAFDGCDALTNIILPDSIISIGDYAFTWCDSLKTFTLPKSVKTVGHWAFSECRSLTDIYVDSENTCFSSIDGVLFNADNTALVCYPDAKTGTSYTISEKVVDIKEGAFASPVYLASIYVDSNNSAFASVDGVLFNKEKTKLIRFPAGNTALSYIVPDGTISLSNYAFYDCYDITDITLPDTLTYIGNYTFSGCDFSNISIPDGVTYIGEGAFDNCWNLESIVLPKNITSIADSTFFYCKNLSNVTIPSGVAVIGSGAFSDCTNLTNIVLPDGVAYIEYEAFGFCRNLSSITIPDSVIEIKQDAFHLCNSLETVYYGGTKEDFEKIEIDINGNDDFLEAEIIYTDGESTPDTDDIYVTFDGHSEKLSNFENGNKVILALYKDKKMTDMQWVDFEFENITFTSSKAYDTAKIFVWKDFINIQPVTDAIILTEN